jgi:cytochrome P450
MMFSESSLQSVIADLFLAGSDTTSTTLSWAVLYLLHYPDVQRKLQDEVDRVVGRHMLPSVTDRKRYNMSYQYSYFWPILLCMRQHRTLRFMQLIYFPTIRFSSVYRYYSINLQVRARCEICTTYMFVSDNDESFVA